MARSLSGRAADCSGCREQEKERRRDAEEYPWLRDHRGRTPPVPGRGTDEDIDRPGSVMLAGVPEHGGRLEGDHPAAHHLVDFGHTPVDLLLGVHRDDDDGEIPGHFPRFSAPSKAAGPVTPTPTAA